MGYLDLPKRGLNQIVDHVRYHLDQQARSRGRRVGRPRERRSFDCEPKHLCPVCRDRTRRRRIAKSKNRLSAVRLNLGWLARCDGRPFADGYDWLGLVLWLPPEALGTDSLSALIKELSALLQELADPGCKAGAFWCDHHIGTLDPGAKLEHLHVVVPMIQEARGYRYFLRLPQPDLSLLTVSWERVLRRQFGSAALYGVEAPLVEGKYYRTEKILGLTEGCAKHGLFGYLMSPAVLRLVMGLAPNGDRQLWAYRSGQRVPIGRFREALRTLARGKGRFDTCGRLGFLRGSAARDAVLKIQADLRTESRASSRWAQ